MDAIEFETQARADAALATLLQEVAAEASAAGADGTEEPQRYVTVTGVDLLFSVAAYALYRWLKDSFDARRAASETATAAARAKIITDMVKEGFPQEQTTKVVMALLEGVAKRANDDPALTKGLALIGKK